MWSLIVSSIDRRGFGAANERLVHEITRKHFPDGYSVVHLQGGWYDPAAQSFVREQSRQIMVRSSSRLFATRWARELGNALHQREVVLLRMGSAVRVALGKPSARHGQ